MSFTLQMNGLIAAYTPYVACVTATNNATTALNAVIATKPSPPTPDTITDTAWNNYTTALNTYNTNLAVAQVTLANAKTAQRNQEVMVLRQLGYNSGETTGNVVNEWVKVTDGGSYTHWVGMKQDCGYLTISLFQPTQPFPNV